MGFRCGIVGLPNVGKSTLFNALTETQAAQAANYPFCTIEPNVGNVGVPERLQFTLVGSPVNEVARIEDLTKTLGHPLLVSEAFANAVPRGWRGLGDHALRGINRPVGIFAPA